jgi:hypothetical protein
MSNVITFPRNEVGLMRMAGLTLDGLLVKPTHNTGPSPTNQPVRRIYDCQDEESKIMLIDMLDDVFDEIDTLKWAFLYMDRALDDETRLEQKIKVYDAIQDLKSIHDRYYDILEKYNA